MKENKNEITVEATTENLDKVLTFVDGVLEQSDCPMREQMQIDVAVEEIYVNIAQYAYPDRTGNATVSCTVQEEPREVVLVFTDSGIPYDPLAKTDPDVTASVEERPIGGLGIYMVKKTMSGLSYQYEDEKNILTIKKNL